MDNNLIRSEVVAISECLILLVERLDSLVKEVDAVDKTLDDVKHESNDLKVKINVLVDKYENQITQLEDMKNISEDIVQRIRDSNDQVAIQAELLEKFDIASKKCRKPLINRFYKKQSLLKKE